MSTRSMVYYLSLDFIGVSYSTIGSFQCPETQARSAYYIVIAVKTARSDWSVRLSLRPPQDVWLPEWPEVDYMPHKSANLTQLLAVPYPTLLSERTTHVSSSNI